ncbi:MAG: MaoC family dehydratase N-terminal domain-containing protein [Chloroflexi bacterium]|nr:MaoC family dehydratase N-terminal domain-containing protein [Chloroflexota bacterium]
MPKEQDWEEAKKWIGKDLLDHPIEGGDEVERTTIRRRCEILEFDCPLHWDDKGAKAHGYKGMFAPHHMLLTYARPAYWKPGMPTAWSSNDPNFHLRSTEDHRKRVPFPPTSAGFATDVEIDYIRPLYIGDRVVLKEDKLFSITPRNTRVGEGAFVMWEQRFYNQRDELVAVAKRGGYQYDPHKMVSVGPGAWKRADEVGTPPPQPAQPQAQPAAPAAGARAAGPGPLSAPNWSKQRYFEDVQEGEELPGTSYAITIQRLVMEAGANRDFAPIHHNREIAQRGGAPDMYANNYFCQGMLERTVREWAGLDGAIKKIGPFRMTLFNPAGETTVARGKVEKKYQEGGESRIDLSLWGEHSKGTTIVGRAVISLPSRTKSHPR